MANNRLYIVHKPTKKCVYLGKRMGWGWHDVPNNVRSNLNKFFEYLETCEEQDSICIGMEDTINNDMAIELNEFDLIR